MSNGTIIGIIVILVLLLILVGIIYYAYVAVRNKIRQYSMILLNNPDPIKGLKQRELDVASTPKSVSSATNLYLPKIVKDFPEFDYDEMKVRAENVLVSFLRSIDEDNPALLSEGLNELKDKLSMRIEMLRQEGRREYFRSIAIHRTEIQLYRKVKGRCSIVFQSSIEYKHFIKKDGKVIKGREDLKEQSKYNIEVSYIQDRDQVEDLEDAGKALNCPNCGAPLPGVGAKKCIYCDSPVVEFNIRTWNFSDVKEVH